MSDVLKNEKKLPEKAKFIFITGGVVSSLGKGMGFSLSGFDSPSPGLQGSECANLTRT